jgi:putative peptidoglycan lipid II flippase
MACLGTAAIAAVALPAAHILVHSGQVTQLIGGFAAFAPGIAGTAVITNLSRVMFALGRLRVAGVALTANWLVVMAADAVLTQVAPPRLEVAALAVGNTIGQSAVAIPLVIATRRIRGRAAVAGVGHAAITGFLASAAGSAAGVMAMTALAPHSGAMDAVAAIVAVGCAVIAFGVVAFTLDRGDLRAIARQVIRRGRGGLPGVVLPRVHAGVLGCTAGPFVTLNVVWHTNDAVAHS